MNMQLKSVLENFIAKVRVMYNHISLKLLYICVYICVYAYLYLCICADNSVLFYYNFSINLLVDSCSGHNF